MIDEQLKKAIDICRGAADDRKRWGRHASFTVHTETQIMDALVCINDSGLLEMGGEKEARIAANRAKGMAEARAIKYKNQLDSCKDRIKELTIALEEEQYARAALLDELNDLKGEKEDGTD